MLNRSGRREIFLQAPHQYYDLRTGRLVARLQAEGDMMAAFWNTAQRHVAAGCDLVHVDHTYLHAFTRAFQQARPQGLIVQIHGFAADKRDTLAGRTADMIISDGTREPSPEAKAFAHCLSEHTRWQVRLFPHDVHELGATTNTVAADLRQQGNSRFIHWELSAQARRELVGSAVRRGDVLACLQHVQGEKPR
ncbi:hypothetical protein [Marinobacterium weihaiense]|uniref:Uncharacterized protein n=1 Tax=Marinobacterium weihaiense TaxID=2851016 RepID=A0ABS6MDX6_9GAMM|nr:hypothetical protein [Marinobacterium weihaiense]MBV0934490.1 hypothetical protein [Marinobacterium weihaiense]